MCGKKRDGISNAAVAHLWFFIWAYFHAKYFVFECHGRRSECNESKEGAKKRGIPCVGVCVGACVCVSVWGMLVRVLCFTVFRHDALLYYSAQRALHMRNGFSLISTAAWGRECTQKQARANLFGRKKQIVVYFPGSGCYTCEEPTALMLQRSHSTR